MRTTISTESWPLPITDPFADLIAQAHGEADRVTIDLAVAVADAADAATAATSRQVLALAEVIRRGIASEELTEAHRKIAVRAQDAVLRSYDQVVTARERPGSRTHYRAAAAGSARRYAAGVLRATLKQRDFYEVTEHGLSMINITQLNQKAKQWARLNAGAGGVGRGSRRSFDVTFSDLVVGAIGLNMEARPAFIMPRGYFFDAGGNKVVRKAEGRRGEDQFWPMGSGPSSGRRRNLLAKHQTTRGIEARNFLDAGVYRVAVGLGEEYKVMYGKLWDRGVIVARGTGTGAVEGPRPTKMFSVRVRTSRR